MSNKQRLDLLLVDKGFFQSRERAKTTIMAGLVFVDNKRIDKPGTLVPEDATIKVNGTAIPFVSRGGLKLEKAIKEFEINLGNLVIMDIGASTGGFTDCALQKGASKSYAIDVGYGQLAWSLRSDQRVVNLERTNIRYLTKDKVPDVVDFVTIDVSFISLTKVLPKAYELSGDKAQVIALIKPQFEVGKDKVGKKGVVRDPAAHIETITKIINEALEIKFRVRGLSFSPVRGPEGNIEYLLYLSKEGENLPVDVNKIVQEAHNSI